MLESHGRSAFQKTRTRELVREATDPGRHAMRSRGVQFPLDGQAHLPQDVLGTIKFAAKNESGAINGAKTQAA